MGLGPAPASQKLLARLGLAQADFDVIEINEALAARGIAALRLLGIFPPIPASTAKALQLRWVTRWACRGRGLPDRRRWSWQ